jgi:DNA polymerase III alpha subunit
MRRIFAGHGDAVDRTGEIAARCGSRSTSCATNTPPRSDGGETPIDRLSRLATEGLAWRYPGPPPGRARCWTTNCA